MNNKLISSMNDVDNNIEKEINKAASDFLDTQEVAEIFCGSYEGWQMIAAFEAGAKWMQERINNVLNKPNYYE